MEHMVTMVRLVIQVEMGHMVVMEQVEIVESGAHGNEGTK